MQETKRSFIPKIIKAVNISWSKTEFDWTENYFWKSMTVERPTFQSNGLILICARAGQCSGPPSSQMVLSWFVQEQDSGVAHLPVKWSYPDLCNSRTVEWPTFQSNGLILICARAGQWSGPPASQTILSWFVRTSHGRSENGIKMNDNKMSKSQTLRIYCFISFLTNILWTFHQNNSQ